MWWFDCYYFLLRNTSRLRMREVNKQQKVYSSSNVRPRKVNKLWLLFFTSHQFSKLHYMFLKFMHNIMYFMLSTKAFLNPVIAHLLIGMSTRSKVTPIFFISIYKFVLYNTTFYMQHCTLHAHSIKYFNVLVVMWHDATKI